MTLDAYIHLLQSADETIDRDALLLFKAYMADMLAYTQSIEHVQSGDMRASTVALGPFPIGQGALESQIISGAWYASEEVARGGTHDWATRTIAEQQARILQLELDVAASAARVLTGGT